VGCDCEVGCDGVTIVGGVVVVGIVVVVVVVVVVSALLLGVVAVLSSFSKLKSCAIWPRLEPFVPQFAQKTYPTSRSSSQVGQ
jgi:hypothetical protein